MRCVCKQPGLSLPRQQRRLQRLDEAPGSQQGFSSCPAVTQITSDTGSLIPRPPYRGSRFSPGRLGPFPRQLRTVQHYLSVVHGEGRANVGAALARQLLTPRHRSSDRCSEPDPISALASFTGETQWFLREALAQQPILGELQAKADALSKQRCHTYSEDEWRILAFRVTHTQWVIISFRIHSKWRGGGQE